MTEKAHCTLGASSAGRWLKCAGSVNLINQVAPERFTSIYAAEGTVAHQVASDFLLAMITPDSNLQAADPINREGEMIEGSNMAFEVTQEMIEAVLMYTDFICQLIEEHEPHADDMWIEKKVELAGIDTDGKRRFGTVDFGMHVPFTKLIVADFKYGAGHKVEADGNLQAMDYALGMLRSLPEDLQREIPEIWIYIIQPRCVGGGIELFIISRVDLMNHEPIILEGIEATKQPDAQLVPGDHCDQYFCPAKNVCPAFENQIQNAVGTAFANIVLDDETNHVVENQLPVPLTLTPERMGIIYKNLPMLKSWIKEMEAHMQYSTQSGAPPTDEFGMPLAKLVKKKTNRAWKPGAEAELKRQHGAAIYSDPKMLTPAQLEKKLGRNVDLSDHYENPDKGLTLVPISDNRPAVNAFEGVVIDVEAG